MKDGKLAVFYDEDTERLTGVKGNITEMTSNEVSKLRIGRRIDMGEGPVGENEKEERVLFGKKFWRGSKINCY